jgi:hypothetical protein
VTNDELIRNLVVDMTPVQPLRPAGVRAFAWIGFGIAWLYIALHVLGPRRDLAILTHDASSLVTAVLLFAVFVAGAITAFRLGVPGLESNRYVRASSLLGSVAWLLTIAAPLATGAHESLQSGWLCVARMAAFASLPVISWRFIVRDAAPLQRGWSFASVFVSTSALALLGTQLACTKDGPLHVLLWHVGPAVIAGIAGLIVSRTAASIPAQVERSGTSAIG